MRATSFADMPCPMARALDCVGSWWSLLIIRDAMLGARRFKHFERSLEIPKNTLSARLSELVESEILEKVPASDGSGYDEYQLTLRGQELVPIIMALTQWGDKWVPHEDVSPFRLVDAKTGRGVMQVWPRRNDGRKIPLKDLTFQRTD